MAFDLMLDMDDDLMAIVRARATKVGTTAEEIIRKALTEGAGLRYEPLDEPAGDEVRPFIHLDPRTP